MARPVSKSFLHDGRPVCANVSGLWAQALAKMEIRTSPGLISLPASKRHSVYQVPGTSIDGQAILLPPPADVVGPISTSIGPDILLRRSSARHAEFRSATQNGPG